MKIALALCSLFVVVYCKTQSYSVRGKVQCNTDPAKTSNVLIKLVDEDNGPNPDDLMGKMKTGPDGSFQLAGKASETFGQIDPRLKIYHDCNKNRLNFCQRKVVMRLPGSFIDGDTFDAGVINLDSTRSTVDCIH